MKTRSMKHTSCMQGSNAHAPDPNSSGPCVGMRVGDAQPEVVHTW